MKADLPAQAIESALGIDVAELEVTASDFAVKLQGWQVERGSRVALIGANGSGKTTIMEALLGVRPAKRLRGSMLGERLEEWRRRPCLRARLGVLMQNASLPAEFHVEDIVALHRELYRKVSSHVLEALGIDPLRRKRYKKLSRGERQRVDLMLALAHEPELAFLDEPLTGLDKQYAHAACELIATLQGTTLVMACHSAEELALCDRVGWIRRGVMCSWDTPERLRAELLGDSRLQVTFVEEQAANAFRTRLQGECTPRHIRSSQPTQLSVFGGEALGELARSLVNDRQIEGLEFGRTSFSDLLYRCATGAAHA